MSEYFISSNAKAKPMIDNDKLFKLENIANVSVLVKKAKGEKCSRCWKILPKPCERKQLWFEKLIFNEKNYYYFGYIFFRQRC